MQKEYPPSFVAKSFVKHYYEILAKNPSELYKFYLPDASFSHHDDDSEETISVVGSDQIRVKVAELDLGSCQMTWADLRIAAQRASPQHILVVVTGHYRRGRGSDIKASPFAHTFLLLGKDSHSFYVSNSIFRAVPVRDAEVREVVSALAPPAHSLPSPPFSSAPAPASPHAAPEPDRMQQEAKPEPVREPEPLMQQQQEQQVEQPSASPVSEASGPADAVAAADHSEAMEVAPAEAARPPSPPRSFLEALRRPKGADKKAHAPAKAPAAVAEPASTSTGDAEAASSPVAAPAATPPVAPEAKSSKPNKAKPSSSSSGGGGGSAHASKRKGSTREAHEEGKGEAAATSPTASPTAAKTDAVDRSAPSASNTDTVPAPSKSAPGSKPPRDLQMYAVYVRPLPPLPISVLKQELQALFTPYGAVRGVEAATNRPFAFVCFADAQGQAAALQAGSLAFRGAPLGVEKRGGGERREARAAGGDVRDTGGESKREARADAAAGEAPAKKEGASVKDRRDRAGLKGPRAPRKSAEDGEEKPKTK